jgi:urease accessory protein
MLRLFQIADSSFPTGGYAFSHGLEGLHALRLIRTIDDVYQFARVHVEESLASQELPAVRISGECFHRHDLDRFDELDRILTLVKPVPAFRASSQRMGRSLLTLGVELFPSSFLLEIHGGVSQGNRAGNFAVAFGAVAASAGAEAGAAEIAFAAGSLNGYVAAAVRLGVIGQSSAQQIVVALEPVLERAIDTARTIDTHSIGGYAPLIDIAGMRQLDLPGRLFAS